MTRRDSRIVISGWLPLIGKAKYPQLFRTKAMALSQAKFLRKQIPGMEGEVVDAVFYADDLPMAELKKYLSKEDLDEALRCMDGSSA